MFRRGGEGISRVRHGVRKEKENGLSVGLRFGPRHAAKREEEKESSVQGWPEQKEGNRCWKKLRNGWLRGVQGKWVT